MLFGCEYSPGFDPTRAQRWKLAWIRVSQSPRRKRSRDISWDQERTVVPGPSLSLRVCSSVKTTNASPAAQAPLLHQTTKGALVTWSSFSLPLLWMPPATDGYTVSFCPSWSLWPLGCTQGNAWSRERLLLVPGLWRQGAGSAQMSAGHTEIIAGFQPCLGNTARLGAATV